MIRFTRDGRYAPFNVLSTGEERTRIPGDRISVRCAWCGKPVTLPPSMSLDEVVNLLEAKKRFRHPGCKGGKVRGEMAYRALFERVDDGSVFVYVPDLPGCTSWAATLDEAREHVREATALWLAVARENGRDAPIPSEIAPTEIEADSAQKRG